MRAWNERKSYNYQHAFLHVWLSQKVTRIRIELESEKRVNSNALTACRHIVCSPARMAPYDDLVCGFSQDPSIAPDRISWARGRCLGCDASTTMTCQQSYREAHSSH